jgi:hypothetical protein
MPPQHLLYSTNVFLKLLIQQRYNSDIHYVWFSDCFDSALLSRYSPSSLVAPSSNPADIYRELARAVKLSDRHCHKIHEQKVSLKTLAIDWEAAGEINSNDKEEIFYMIDNATFSEWRPLIYITPRVLVESRLQVVPPNKRASLALEYIVPDLKQDEFDIIEL